MFTVDLDCQSFIIWFGSDYATNPLLKEIRRDFSCLIFYIKSVIIK